MINFIREFIKKNEKINICYYYNKENIEEKVSEISKELGLPICSINVNDFKILALVKKLKNNNNDSIIYLTGLNTIGVIKQCLITPFMDNRSERKNSVFIIGVNPIDKEKTLCPQILKKLDVTYRQK